MVPDGTSGLAAGDGDVTRASRRKEAADLFHRHGEIGIGKEAVFAEGFQHAATDGAALARQVFVEEAQTWKGGDQPPGDFQSTVSATILYHQDFRLERLFFQECKDLPQGAGQA